MCNERAYASIMGPITRDLEPGRYENSPGVNVVNRGGEGSARGARQSGGGKPPHTEQARLNHLNVQRRHRAREKVGPLAASRAPALEIRVMVVRMIVVRGVVIAVRRMPKGFLLHALPLLPQLFPRLWRIVIFLLLLLMVVLFLLLVQPVPGRSAVPVAPGGQDQRRCSQGTWSAHSHAPFLLVGRGPKHRAERTGLENIAVVGT